MVVVVVVVVAVAVAVPAAVRGGVVVVVEGALPVDGLLDGAELLDLAGDGYGPLLLEPELLLGLLEELHEPRVVHVHHGYHEPPPLLLALPHHHRQAPLRHVMLVLPRLLLVVVRQVQVEEQLVPASH